MSITTETVRDAWTSHPLWRDTATRGEAEAAFDKWLEAIKAEAWEEGEADGRNNQINEYLSRRQTTNPYRKD